MSAKHVPPSNTVTTSNQFYYFNNMILYKVSKTKSKQLIKKILKISNNIAQNCQQHVWVLLWQPLFGIHGLPTQASQWAISSQQLTEPSDLYRNISHLTENRVLVICL